MPAYQIERGIDILSELARKVAERAITNDHTLNTKKTRKIFFGSPVTLRLFKRLGISELIISNKREKTQFVSDVLRLGVLLDTTLSWRPQVNRVTRKVSKALFCLEFIKSSNTQVLRKRLPKSLVIPHLDYCSLVYLDASLALRTRLQRLENASLRYIFGMRCNAHVSPFDSKSVDFETTLAGNISSRWS